MKLHKYSARGVWAAIDFHAKQSHKKKLIRVVFEVFCSFPKILAQEKSKCMACEGKRSSNKTAKKDPFYTKLNLKD